MTVFISHSTTQRDVANHLALFLERKGIDTWIAPRDIPAGSEWDESIDAAIRHSSVFLLLFSSNADVSKHIKREIAIADRLDKPILPIRVENVEPERLSYWLATTQWFEWLDQRDSTLELLVHSVRPYINRMGTRTIRHAAPIPTPSANDRRSETLAALLVGMHELLRKK